ncbi:MAG: HAD hydrolase family protein, partial [Melioribacteraceae bacterium]|nr:HAD hydrolase family protein [Melioribacteraceae bacterium]
MNLSRELISKLGKIQIVITDVDGVLTDGGLYYTSDGLLMKKFNVKDGMGMKLLRDSGIKNAIITTDTSELIKIRGERLKVDYLYLGVWDKENKLLEICSSENISPDNVAFIGDDVNDIGIIKAAGFSACPKDAVPQIKDIVDLVLPTKGGKGVFREFADLILRSQLKS